MRRIMVMLVGAAVVVPTAGVSVCSTVAADAPVVAGTPVELVASGPWPPRRGAPSRTVPRSGVRQYRSYSIEPGIAAESAPAPVMEGLGVQPRPAPVQSSAAPRSPRPSKPSFMRADSKARGQFGR